MRLFLGDQSVVITKDFICHFEEADVCVRVVLSSGADSVDWSGQLTCTEHACSPGWEAGRPGRSTGTELCSLFQATVDRGSNGRISDHWRSTGPVDRQPPGLKNCPTTSFF